MANPENIRRVIDAFEDAEHLPDWFQYIEAVPDDLSSRGVDLVIQTTDAGELYVQVHNTNSGRKRAQKARARIHSYGEEVLSTIGIVMVKAKNDEDIRQTVLAGAERLREMQSIKRP